MRIETGFFFISDITGFTAFVSQSELDHAKDILDALFESVLGNTGPPLILADTEGDAVFTYVPEGSLLRSDVLLETAERLYFEFRDRLELMKLSTTCTCKACSNMAVLDLKIFIHYGQYLPQQLGDRVQLQGSDVILVHRLMKNSVKDTLGLTGYALITDAALQTMGGEALAQEMIAHAETYEHLGEVKAWVQDLRSAWREERKLRRSAITKEDAWAYGSVDVPIPPWVAWDYATHVEHKRQYFDMISVSRTDADAGRIRQGATFHCAHDLGDILYQIKDWSPPHQFTGNTQAFGLRFYYSVRITPMDGGSRLEILYETPFEGEYEDLTPVFSGIAQTAAARFGKMIRQEIEQGRLQPAENPST